MAQACGRPRRVLSDEELARFRQLAADGRGLTMEAIAQALGMAERTAKRLATEHGIQARRRQYGPGASLTRAQIEEIRHRLARGESDRTIAAHLGCAPAVVFQVRKRRGWAKGTRSGSSGCGKPSRPGGCRVSSNMRYAMDNPTAIIEAWLYAVLHLAMALVVAGVWARARANQLDQEDGDE